MWICPAADATHTTSERSECPERIEEGMKSAFSLPDDTTSEKKAAPKVSTKNQQTDGKCFSVPRAVCTPKTSSGIFLPYFLGIAASGILVALCTAEQRKDFFSWGEACLTVFSDTPLRLFSTMFLSAILLLTILAALGFCTFGKWLSKLLLFFYGIGSGALCLQLFMGSGWRGWLFFAAVPGMYLVILAYCLSHLSGYSAQLSGFLLSQLIKKDPPAYRVSGRILMDRYFAFCCWQIAACGILSTAAKPLLTMLF